MRRTKLQELVSRVIDLEKRFAGSTRSQNGIDNTLSRIENATASAFIWATQFAKTRNEHWVEEHRPSPYEHFPLYAYLQDIFDVLESDERVIWFEKSRENGVMIRCCIPNSSSSPAFSFIVLISFRLSSSGCRIIRGCGKKVSSTVSPPVLSASSFMPAIILR